MSSRRAQCPWFASPVFRQAAQSRIITSAHRINQRSIPDLSPPGPDSDFYFVQADDPETAVGRIIELVRTRIPKRFGLDPIRDIQVLCPMNRGGVGARSLNIELQAALNPAGDRKVERFGWTFAPSDKVMQIENDYDKEVYNGDIGTIDDVDPAEGELTDTFDGRTVTGGRRGSPRASGQDSTARGCGPYPSGELRGLDHFGHFAG
jgi:exodeoxyribonuclease V alpha subunit